MAYGLKEGEGRSNALGTGHTVALQRKVLRYIPFAVTQQSVIETMDQRRARISAEIAERKRRAAEYEKKMGTGPEPVVLRNLQEAPKSVAQQPKKSRADYFRKYRRSPKTECPKCGHRFELVKEKK